MGQEGEKNNTEDFKYVLLIFKALALSGKSPLNWTKQTPPAVLPRGDGEASHRCLLQELSQGACVLGNLLSHSRGMWGCVQRTQKNEKESQLVPLSTANFPVSLGHCAVSPHHQTTTSTGQHCLLCTHPLRSGPTRMATTETGKMGQKLSGNKLTFIICPFQDARTPMSPKNEQHEVLR